MQLTDIFTIIGFLILISGIGLGLYKWRKSESNKVKSDMFAERKRIYEILRTLIANILSKGDISNEDLNRFSHDIKDYPIMTNS